MSLNDSAVADLNNSVVEDGLITPPDLNGPSVNIIAVAATKENGLQSRINDAQNDLLFGAHIDPNELPDLSAEFVVLDNHHKKLIDLSEIEATLSGNTGISQEDANTVQDTFGKFFTPRLSVLEFTKAPSKVNFNYTKTFMRNRITTEEVVFNDKVNTHVQSVSDLCNKLDSAVNAEAVDKLSRSVETLQALYGDILHDFSQLSNMSFYIGANMENFLCLPITSEGFKPNTAGMTEEIVLAASHADQAIVALSGILASPHTCAFIHSVVDGKDATAVYSQDMMALMVKKSVMQVQDILNFYSMADAPRQVYDINNAVKALADKCEAIKSATVDGSVVGEAALAAVKQVVDGLTGIRHVVASLTVMNASAHVILDFIAKNQN